jgi:hypothetical protein
MDVLPVVDQVDQEHPFALPPTPPPPVHPPIPTTPLPTQQQQQQRPSQVAVVVRYVMTLLLGLLIISALLSITAVQHYKFILSVLWIIIVSLFVGFCYFIYETILDVESGTLTRDGRSRRSRGTGSMTVFHPMVHKVNDYIVSGILNFIDDCRTEYTELKLILPDNDDGAHQPQPKEQEQSSLPKQRRKTTQFFRVIVRPILHITFRRRKQRPQRPRQYDDDTNTHAMYTPPTQHDSIT